MLYRFKSQKRRVKLQEALVKGRKMAPSWAIGGRSDLGEVLLRLSFAVECIRKTRSEGPAFQIGSPGRAGLRLATWDQRKQPTSEPREVVPGIGSTTNDVTFRMARL